MAALPSGAPSSRWWPLQTDDVTTMPPCSNHSMGVGGVGVTPGVPATTDGSGGAGGRTAGGGLAADGGATQSKADNLRMRLREDVLEK